MFFFLEGHWLSGAPKPLALPEQIMDPPQAKPGAEAFKIHSVPNLSFQLEQLKFHTRRQSPHEDVSKRGGGGRDAPPPLAVVGAPRGEDSRESTSAEA